MMTENKSPRLKEEKAKKRKREASEGDTKPKRHRRRQRSSGHATESQKSPNGAVTVTTREDSGTVSGGESVWKVSKPMGGRMLDIDPILSADEQHLILIYTTSIQVYNASDSLLVRRIPICSLDSSSTASLRPATIVAARLSVENAKFIWVACSDGAIYHVDWTVGTEPSLSFRTASRTAKAMVIVPFPGKGKGDMAVIAESKSDHKMDVVAYHGNTGSAFESKNIHLQLVKNRDQDVKGLQLLESSQDGRVLIGALLNTLFLGVASVPKAENISQVQYNFYSFTAPDIVTTIDVRTSKDPDSRTDEAGGSQESHDRVVDVIAGGARGAIYVYRDAISQLEAAKQANISVSKLHWHRKAVHTAKWSRDGNYILSGGSENAVVMWQNDTSRRSLLQYLSGAVENIVVSASGSSFVVHLDDNSAMIISTAELQPTAYIAGIQSAVADVATPKDLLVKRCWTVASQVRRPVPAAVNPKQPSKLHVCVGNGRQATMSGDFSAPLLQTFDLKTFTSVSKQALALTMPTHVNLTTQGHAIDEPLITHVVFSSDGKWLASVDEWRPPQGKPGDELDDQVIREWYDVHLRFWAVADNDEPMKLVARFNDPHATRQQESVVDVAANPSSAGFATLGTDGIVRLWRPRVKKQVEAVKGVAADGRTQSWGCSQMAVLGASSGRQLATDVGTAPKAQGSIAYSEDGSILFAAYGAGDSGAVYVVDTASGEVVKILDELWAGRLHAISVLSSFVVVLSDELRVYDVVSDELQYGIVMPKHHGMHELLQLAVDRRSDRFSIALPMGKVSSVAVFDPEDPDPLMVRQIPHRIISLISAPSASGFVALDDVAQIWVLAEGSDPSAIASSHALQDLHLDGPKVEDEDEKMESDAALNSDSDGEVEMGSEDVKMNDDDDEDDWTAQVVPRQYLADIFNAAPAFSAPSAEDMFYKVVDLLVPAASA
ncbi:U3 small nucleolar RNA-associated protein 17 [Ophiocordyceps camponoti-floridani]|uniref:U3 small nucleolar RNA-associated protein 17 n=1 Tax=Ophiocordyceps camponoti-floridani TaxID=2030778 RepID=A0A8H4QA25_9HYPO|nr:U3 small nucleolar RNA-associated protein 17 [Ophiocordyceps camponoti-floridani]